MSTSVCSVSGTVLDEFPHSSFHSFFLSFLAGFFLEFKLFVYVIRNEKGICDLIKKITDAFFSFCLRRDSECPDGCINSYQLTVVLSPSPRK